MSKAKNVIFALSLLLILVAAILFSIYPAIAPYILSLGVSLYGAIIFTTPYPGKSIRGKRLFNMQIFSVLLMVAACYLMFIGYSLWVLLLLIAAIFMLYGVRVSSKIWEKEQQEDEQN